LASMSAEPTSAEQRVGADPTAAEHRAGGEPPAAEAPVGGEPRPLRADARRNRERILAAARECFAEDAQATQMDDIARHAGVGVGTVYRHFPTKSVLVGELVRAKFLGHAETAREWFSRADGWAAFEGFIRQAVAEMGADAAQQRMMWVADAAAYEYAEDAQAVLSAEVDKLIGRAKAAGEMREDFTVDDMPTVMCAIGSVMSAGPVKRPDRLVELLLAAIGPAGR
jgi:AcrR family transcriptional regulator